MTGRAVDPARQILDQMNAGVPFSAAKVSTDVDAGHECDFPETCHVCAGPAPASSTVVTVEATFEARFPGQCPECDLPIHKGQEIAKLSSGAYIHDDCSEDYPR